MEWSRRDRKLFEAFAKEIQDRVKKQRALVGEDAATWGSRGVCLNEKVLLSTGIVRTRKWGSKLESKPQFERRILSSALSKRNLSWSDP
jgi:hypothetical protein